MEKFILFYKIRNKNNTIRILGEEFIRNNKNKGRIIYKNKSYHFHELTDVSEYKNNILKIKLILNKYCCNKSCMFKNCSSLIHIKFDNQEDIFFNNKNNLFIGNSFSFDNPQYEYNKREILFNDINWKNKITNISEIFSNCSTLISLPDISEWDTSYVKDMNKIFYNCRCLSSLPNISKWNTSNTVDMNRMFYNCASLSLLPDLSQWNTNNVNNMEDIFYNCSSLVSLPNVYKWNDNNNNYNSLVKDCFSLISFPDINKRKDEKIYMNSSFEKISSIFKLIYQIKDEKTIELFHPYFVYINKKNV